MNTPREYITQQTKRCREEWFKNHRASVLLKNEHATVIDWTKPGTWTYGLRIIIHRRWLIIVGDIEEATYEWGQDITPAFLSELNFDYFLGKCRAAASGRKFHTWNSRVAYANLQESKRELGKRYTGLMEINAGTCREDFEQIVRREYENGLDPETCSSLIEGGLIPDPMAVGHFVAVQMAMKQLIDAGLV